MKIRAGVFGATGYAGYELVQLLRRHPSAELVFATSEQSAGGWLSDSYPCLDDVALVRADEAPLGEVECAFCSLPHGASMATVRRAREAGVRVVDLSADFRLPDAAVYERWYKTAHEAPQLLAEAVYGLPELHREAIRGAQLVANPGCYPTSVILGCYPLAAQGLLEGGHVIVDSKSGVSGAGRSPSPTTHFCQVNESLAPYNVGHVHRHIPEMEQELSRLAGQPVRVTFAPHLVPVTRGMLSTLYVRVPPQHDAAALRRLYQETYAGEPLVHVLPEGTMATMSWATGTERCVISLHDAGVPGEAIVVSAIDNLGKGAAGQALQNMNVMFGLDETAGLRL
ncbi:MAG TPA: N-acetyl-gamma-glutamyl-phosphate reductase [Anaerolineae bacterium]|nr:N-acetyl-gamma-glutamyl-phosphate reductase [Anaerolineae bacterium]HOQ97568.1 N-acetyl-gamma-glutamyl-phosphate reductase [Anaerolineae bacterium]HPL30653.1 N-acetyl-gamma-glutamyl-phosphate reductase [Anaerolineae bacterium]